MIEGVDWDTVLSASCGGAAAVATFKAFLSRSLEEISRNTEKLQQSQLALSAITAKLESFEKIPEVLLEHDRKIARLEARLDEATRSRNTTREKS